ncbi:hypothetical protein AB870_13795 [Pandoraea faecigallinarum]|uniref:Uncharacterized protein n=2 Tax=Pandoraea faecigallinarum TaxID=656179 RepID=A0A0H3WRX6_9BURK|nr:hypothetical protein AB870_13795 [Pandoraea faecigallinarum]
MQGDLRTCLRQLHQLPGSILGYLPLWLETLRRWLDADGVAALWCHLPGEMGDAGEAGGPVADAGTTGATCWYAPQAPVFACERLAACGWTMPSMTELQQSLAGARVLRGHARRGGHRPDVAMLRRPPALDACLPGSEVLDVCVLPMARTADVSGACHDGTAAGTAPIGALRLLVSRGDGRPAFTSREIDAFEMAAGEFGTAPERSPLPDLASFPSLPFFPPLALTVPATAGHVPDASGGANAIDSVSAICGDISGMLVWHRRQPEWADPAALALMRRVWQPVPGQAWTDACVVVRACQRLADELTRHPGSHPPQGAQVGARVPVPGGTLHLHATHLCGMGGSATERVRVALHLAVPPAVRLLQRLWRTALTPVQREIAMRLLAGQSRAQTREACAIGAQTLKTHLSLMRARLDPVRDAPLLLGLGGGAMGANAHPR